MIFQHFTHTTHVKFDETGQAVSEKIMYKDYTILYIYIAKGQGQITPQGIKFSL